MQFHKNVYLIRSEYVKYDTKRQQITTKVPKRVWKRWTFDFPLLMQTLLVNSLYDICFFEFLLMIIFNLSLRIIILYTFLFSIFIFISLKWIVRINSAVIILFIWWYWIVYFFKIVDYFFAIIIKEIKLNSIKI